MQDTLDIIKNVQMVYDSNTNFQVLKDFERVLDELDIYVYDNWEDGELAAGPNVERHWVTCSFMWPRDKMPDPMGGKRLVDYDCKVKYQKEQVMVPRKIKDPNDMRPGTKKGKLDRMPVWVVEIQMPKKLIVDIFSGWKENNIFDQEPATDPNLTSDVQPAEDAAAETDDLDLGL